MGRVGHVMDFRLLGPVSAFSGQAEIPLGPPKRRALLALLVLADGAPVGAERITEALWDDRPPTHARTVVYGHVSALRGLLRTERDTDVVTRDSGYALRAAPGSADLWRFRELVRRSAAPPRGNSPRSCCGRPWGCGAARYSAGWATPR